MKPTVFPAFAVSVAAVGAIITVDERAIETYNAAQRRSCGSTDSSPFPMPLCRGIVIEDATIDDLQHHMASGKLTSQQLVECYIARIKQTNP